MKKIKPPSYVTVLILSAITVVFWILFSVIQIFTNKGTETVPSNVSAPLNPSLDKNTLDKLETRVYFEEGDIPESMVTNITPTEAPVITEAPDASVSATPTATEGAVIQ